MRKIKPTHRTTVIHTHNVNRLQNEIRVRDRELDAANKEITAQKSQAAAKER